MAKCLKDGCKAQALTNDKYCFFHSQRPEIIEKQAAARSKGGKRAKIVEMPYIKSIDSIDDLKKILLDCMNELRLSGSDNVISKARAVGFLVNVAASLIKDGDMEQRIAALEEIQSKATS